MMHSQQFSFDFSKANMFSSEDFFLSEANADAAAWIRRWPELVRNTSGIVTMPFSHALLVYGPQGCGKTHLAHVWQERTGAEFIAANAIHSLTTLDAITTARYFILEECHTIRDETAFLHFFNMVREKSAYVLFTSLIPVAQMHIQLPDLRSRLNAIPAVEVQNPDDELFRTMLVKHFSDRQLRVGEDVIDFLLSRIERSFVAAEKVVERLDNQSLYEQHSVTVPFARKVLESLV